MTGAIHSMGGGNTVFRDIGFPENEAQTLLLRGDLDTQIRIVIDTLGITQAEAAKSAGIPQPRLNDLLENRIHKFTLDAPVTIAAQLGLS